MRREKGKEMKGYYTQLTLHDRHLIEHMLNERTPLNKIASTLHRDPSADPQCGPVSGLL